MFEAVHKPPATFPMGIESHGGEDVGLWATGILSVSDIGVFSQF
jgi:hypothetical protein